MIVLNIINPGSLAKIHDGSFPLPDMYDPAFLGKKTIIDNKNIVCFGMVKQTLEGILVLNHNLPVITKTRAIIELIRSFKEDMERIGQRECHVFVKNEEFKGILTELGFEECQGGTPMIIHF